MASERSLTSNMESTSTVNHFSEQESKKIARTKGLMLFAIVAIGLIVTGSTYRFLKANQQHEFETQVRL